MKHLSEEQIQTFKEKLLAEKKTLEDELATVGRINPSNPNDWEAKGETMDIMQADRNEAADAIEEFEENAAILRELEIRFNNVKKALASIEAGTYGLCRKDNEPIPLERLEANPAATTCLEHT